jgi:hypothetical protein
MGSGQHHYSHTWRHNLPSILENSGDIWSGLTVGGSPIVTYAEYSPRVPQGPVLGTSLPGWFERSHPRPEIFAGFCRPNRESGGGLKRLFNEPNELDLILNCDRFGHLWDTALFEAAMASSTKRQVKQARPTQADCSLHYPHPADRPCLHLLCWIWSEQIYR